MGRGKYDLLVRGLVERDITPMGLKVDTHFRISRVVVDRNIEDVMRVLKATEALPMYSASSKLLCTIMTAMQENHDRWTSGRRYACALALPTGQLLVLKDLLVNGSVYSQVYTTRIFDRSLRTLLQTFYREPVDFNSEWRMYQMRNVFGLSTLVSGAPTLNSRLLNKYGHQ